MKTTKKNSHRAKSDTQGTKSALRSESARRKQAEKALQKSQENFERIVTTLQDILYSVDAETREFSYLSPAFERLLGYTMEDIRQMGGRQVFMAKVIQEGMFAKQENTFEQLFSEKVEVPSWTEWWRCKDGKLVCLEDRSMPVYEGKRLIGTQGILRDVTERKRAEAELMREKRFLEALHQNSPAAIVVLDTDGNIVSCNPAFERLYGYSSREITGQNLDALITTIESIQEAARLTKEAQTSLVHTISKRRRKDGSLVDVEIFGVPVYVDEERVGAFAIYHDISDLMRARQEAEDANRAKSEFLANMSHEIRTPMNGVIGMLELALDTSLTPEQQDYLQSSLLSAEALLVLLNDVLDYSKIEAGRLELESINFNLRNTVEDVAYTLAKRTQDKGLELACLVHPDIIADLRGDPGRLRQILVNLVGNAIKFTHQGEVVIRAEPIEEKDDSAIVRFSVQDTGIGIPIERQAKIFDRFTQADGSTTRKYGGSGLGLTISKQLVELMGGTIGLESQPGIGSTFWFTLKFEKQPLKAPAAIPVFRQEPVSLGEIRVLCVDDNQTNRTVLTRMVEGFGCRIDTTPSGSKALEILHHAARVGDAYHIVLLDMQMPGMDGEQVARAIKNDPVLREVKIIILTSMGQRGDAARLEALGCSGYLLKPVKQQMLYEALIAVLGRNEEERPGLVTRHVLSEQRRRGQRILLAEDNPINQKLAVVLLQKHGYSVDAVEDGVEALEKMKTERYNAVLMDVQMPAMDGFESTRLIRAWESSMGRHVPIIAMTAHAMQGDRERCLEAGMDDYVSKPLQPRVLFNALDRCIGKDVSESAVGPGEEAQDYSSLGAFAQDENPLLKDDGLFGEKIPAPQREAEKAPLKSVSSSSSQSAPIDLDMALHRFEGDRDFMLEMCKEFMDHLPERLVEIHAALDAGDANALSRYAHNLKGISLNFSADSLAGLAADLEERGRRENLADAPALVVQLDTEAQRLQEYLAQHLR